MVKTRQLLVWLLSLGVLVTPVATQAFVGRTGNEVIFSPADKLDGVTYAFGQQITVDAPLPDDFICLGSNVFINQPVAGDIICLADNINIKAPVGGSVRLFGNNVQLDSSINRNAMLSGHQLLLGEHSEIKGETLLANLILESHGSYKKAVHGLYNQAKLAGHYESPVNLKELSGGISQLVVDPTAEIGAGLTYRAEQPAQIDDGAHINGEVVHKVATAQEKQAARVGWWWSKLLHLFMLLIVALVFYSLWPNLGDKLTKAGTTKPVIACLYGLITLCLLPLAAIIIGFTIIGLPLSLMLLAIYLFLLYVGRLIAGYWLGLKIMPRAKSHLWSFLLGTTIVVAIGWLPIIGGAIMLFITWWGVGVVEQMLLKTRANKKVKH